jgi:hypothetical protein
VPKYFAGKSGEELEKPPQNWRSEQQFPDADTDFHNI